MLAAPVRGPDTARFLALQSVEGREPIVLTQERNARDRPQFHDSLLKLAALAIVLNFAHHCAVGFAEVVCNVFSIV